MTRWRGSAAQVIVLGLLAIFVLLPFYWVVAGSFRTPEEVIARAAPWFPRSLTLEHYGNLLRQSPFPTYLLNSLIVAFGTMAFTVVVSTLAAYGFYRLRFPGREWLLNATLLAYAFPGVLLIVPMYGMMSTLGLIDSLMSLIVINVTFAAPFAVWMMKAFFQTIPLELEEAAILDGASRFQVLTRIMLPLTAPGVASIAIFAFVMSWTEYMFASILILSDDQRTLPVGLAGIIGQYQIDWGLLLAGATLITLPVVILFAMIGRYFVEGMTAGAVK